MPNHVFTSIAFNNLSVKQKEKLNEIANTHNGLCGYYRPMPDDIRNTTSPCLIVTQKEYDKQMKENEKIDRTQPWYHEPKPITKKMQKAFFDKYGTDNWYDWAYNNWGTKWGCYDNEIDGETLRFSTAWGLFNISILDKLAEDFPEFNLHFEEEQGWGGIIEYVNGEFHSMDEYGAPMWDCTGIDTDEGRITQLLETIHDVGFREGADAGYYYEYDLNEPVPVEVLEKHKLVSSKTQNQETI